MKASNSSDGKYDEYLRKGMRNSTHIVVPLGVSETKQGLLQDRYSPGRDAALVIAVGQHVRGSGVSRGSCGSLAELTAWQLHRSGPGENEPKDFILTTALGIIGAFVATYLGQAIGLCRDARIRLNKTE